MAYIHELLSKAKVRIDINDVLQTMLKHQIEFSNRKTAPEILGLLKIEPSNIARAAFTSLLSRYKRGLVKGKSKYRKYTIINLRDGKGYFIVDLENKKAVEYIFKESLVAFKDTITRESNSTKKLEKATNSYISYGNTLEERSERTGLVEGHKNNLSTKATRSSINF